MGRGETYDAVVVGAGPNGLAAANRLVDAGWSVLVLEQQPEPGGAVRSARDVHPDFVHDTFSAFYPLAAASPGLRALALEEHGVVWQHAPAVLGHPSRDGSWALLHRDRDVTARLADQRHPGDGDAWLRLCAQWDGVGPALVEGLMAPFPPVRPVPRGVAGLARAGGPGVLRTLLGAADDLAARFGGEGPQLLVAGSAAHADVGLDRPGSALTALILLMLGQTVGFPVPRGGAGELTAALARRLVSRGGELRCGVEVEHLDVRRGRVVGVRTSSGPAYTARAVIAGVTAPQLYGVPGSRPGLLDDGDVPWRVRAGMRRFELDPATVKVDWALDGPVPWAGVPTYAPGTVHVADDHDELARSLRQVEVGVVPDRPFLLVGQMSTSDPSRSPAGTESCWAYTHVPQRVVGDAGGDAITGRWDRDECERMADRVQARLETLAPGFGSRVLARRVLGPRELEARDANLVGGAINGGTARLRQQLVLRPVPGPGRAGTGVRGLYLGSSSAHPGGGVHGAAGLNAARAALAAAVLRRSPRSSGR